MKNELNNINLKDFKNAIAQAIEGKHTSVAPLGMSGQTIYLHQKEDEGRVQQVSIRLYCGDPELLITNNSKSFLFYGRYDVRLGVDFLSKEYYRMFKKIKNKIPLNSDQEKELKVIENPIHSIGFRMVEALRRL